MKWKVFLCEEFEPEFDALPAPLQEELVVYLKVLEAQGPMLGRPLVDTLKGSSLPNSKNCVSRGKVSPTDIFSPSIPNEQPLF